MVSSFPVIHAVTDSTAVMQKGFAARAGKVMQSLGARGAVHLRCSRTSGRDFFGIAQHLAGFQEETGCWLIVNDRVDIALAVGAAGAQLASHSLQIREARLVAPLIPLGASVHSVEEAVEAEKAGAAWCVAGTIFETPSHEGRAPARIDFIKRLVASVGIPVIAIGGIAPENVGELLKAGAYGVAIIRGVAWSGETDALAGDTDTMKTRLTVQPGGVFAEPVTRYISAYDSVSRSERNDHADGERRSPGAGTP